MEFVVVSDNHGRKEVLDKIRAAHPNAAGFIHCGDSEMRASDLKDFHVVTGNNDYYENFPESLVVDLEGTRIYVTHSHMLPWGRAVDALVERAKAKDCVIACYGHTHRFDFREVNGVIVVNPGSLYYNRDGSKTSYALVRVEDGVVSCQRLYSEDL